jgi:hypothetical protein
MRRSPMVSTPPDAPATAPTGAEQGASLAVGMTLADRFHVDEQAGEALGGAFFGTDRQSGAKVVLIPVSAEREKSLRPGVGLEHAHLAPLFAVEPLGDGFVAVAATVEGETLAERLDAIGKKPSVDAVRSSLRVADALSHLHEVGGVHGWLTPQSVVADPIDGARPRIGWNMGSDQPLRTPERAPDGAPSIADDTWATAGLLHWMLTGGPPPAAGYASEDEIEKAGVADAALRTALFHTLTQSRPDRQSDLRPLRRELARWFVEHAGEEPIVPTHRATHPPPLPPSIRPSNRPSARKSLPPLGRRRLGVFATGAIVLGVVGGIALTFLRPKQVKLVALPEKSVEPPAASALELGEVPVTGDDEPALGSKLATCVAGYLPKGAFGKTPSVEWLCGETDPREGADKLHSAVVSSAPKGATTDAMRIFSRIGWYAMPAFAVVRAGCCADAKPLALPEENCGMSAALTDVGKAAMASDAIDESLKKYTESIHCELNRGGAKMLRRAERPAGGEDTAFLELIKHLE